MKYDRATYTSFDHFCYVVTKKVESCIRRSAATEKILLIIGMIALIFFHLGVVIFLALCGLLFCGAVAYYGGIGALFAAHPLVAVILIGIMSTAGFGMARSVKAIYDNRAVFAAIKDGVVSRFRSKFLDSLAASNSFVEITSEHEALVDIWVKQATIEVIAELMKRTGLQKSDILLAPLQKIIGKDLTAFKEAFRDGIDSDALNWLQGLFT